jgi:8-oxo-dGTP diphosphatase
MAEGDEHRVIHAAGAVIWRPGAAGIDVALVHRPRYDDWSHPKGKQQRGEHLLLTATREAREETGFGVVLGRPLSPSVYEISSGTKHVSFWAAQVADSSGFVPNDEVDEVAWLPATAARERMSYERDITLLDEVLARPVPTVPMIVLRHAEAGRKQGSAGKHAAAEDLARPLDARGVAEARALASLLASYGRCQVISSAAERCLATVRPYAQAVGAQVQVEPTFTAMPDSMSPAEQLAGAVGREAQGTQDGGSTGNCPQLSPSVDEVASLATRLAVSGVPTLVCAHRENLPAIIDAALLGLGAGSSAAGPPATGPNTSEPLGKSEFWVLHSADRSLVAAERHGLTH